MSSRGQQPDHHAFLDATLPYTGVVYNIARTVAEPPSTAEDLVQETYLRAFQHFDQHHGTNTRAWLAAICLNVARSEGRRRRRRPTELPEDAIDPSSLAPSENGQSEVGTLLDRRAIRAALAELPQQQRLSVLLMDVAGYTASETAEILTCPRGTVLARVHRGRRKLAVLLEDAGALEGARHGSA